MFSPSAGTLVPRIGELLRRGNGKLAKEMHRRGNCSHGWLSTQAYLHRR
jgi:hypothetical protein